MAIELGVNHSHWYKFKAYLYKQHRLPPHANKMDLRREGTYANISWTGSSRNTYVMSPDPAFKGVLWETRNGKGKELAHTMISMLILVEWYKHSVLLFMERWRKMLFRTGMKITSLPCWGWHCWLHFPIIFAEPSFCTALERKLIEWKNMHARKHPVKSLMRRGKKTIKNPHTLNFWESLFLGVFWYYFLFVYLS